MWLATTAIVVEIESPDDETWQKLPFYGANGVDEVLIVSGGKRTVKWMVLDADGYRPAGASRLLGPDSSRLGDLIDWPPDD